MTEPTQPEQTQQTPAQQRSGDTLGAHLVAFALGVAGGFMFSQMFENTWWGMLLFYVCALPIMVAGFTCGRRAVVTAAIAGILIAFIRNGTSSAMIFALLFALPGMVLTRVALINFAKPNETPRWVSSGTVLLAALTVGTVVMVTIATYLELNGPGIASFVDGMLNVYKEMLTNSGDPQMTAEHVQPMFDILRASMPMLLLMFWFCLIVFCGTLALYIARETGLALRPGLPMKTIEMPVWLSVVFVLCVVGSTIAPADTSMVLSALAMLYALGVILHAIGALHRWIDARALSHNWSDGQRYGLYVFIYVLLFVLPPFMIFLLLLGLIAPFTELRHQQRTVTPDSK